MTSITWYLVKRAFSYDLCSYRVDPTIATIIIMYGNIAITVLTRKKKNSVAKYITLYIIHYVINCALSTDSKRVRSFKISLRPYSNQNNSKNLRRGEPCPMNRSSRINPNRENDQISVNGFCLRFFKSEGVTVRSRIPNSKVMCVCVYGDKSRCRVTAWIFMRPLKREVFVLFHSLTVVRRRIIWRKQNSHENPQQHRCIYAGSGHRPRVWRTSRRG